MPRPPTGSVVVDARNREDPSYAIRFTAYGKRRFVTLGRHADGWTAEQAKVELANVLADVRRGIWRPSEPAPVPEQKATDPKFWEFATEWFAAREAEGLAHKTLVDLEWSLNKHLFWFAHHRLSEITVQEVDRFKVGKATERATIEA